MRLILLTLFVVLASCRHPFFGQGAQVPDLRGKMEMETAYKHEGDYCISHQGGVGGNS